MNISGKSRRRRPARDVHLASNATRTMPPTSPANIHRRFAAVRRHRRLVQQRREHRHNFKGCGGATATSCFSISRIGQAGLGPGISSAGFDDLPLRHGIDNAESKAARSSGVTIPSATKTSLTLRAAACTPECLRWRSGSRSRQLLSLFEHRLAHASSTGTDWFQRFQVYARSRGAAIPAWLDAVSRPLPSDQRSAAHAARGRQNAGRCD